MIPAAVIHQDSMNEIVLLKVRIKELEALMADVRQAWYGDGSVVDLARLRLDCSKPAWSWGTSFAA